MDEEYYPEPEKFLPERYESIQCHRIFSELIHDDDGRYEGRTRLADHYQGNSEWQQRDHYGMPYTPLTPPIKFGTDYSRIRRRKADLSGNAPRRAKSLESHI